MTTFLQATVYKTGSTSKVEHTERDDEAGRAAMDRWAQERLLHPSVKSITVGHVNRIAGTGKGRAR